MATSFDEGDVRLPAYILAGGQSSRFGTDKARALLDGQPLILRIARKLETCASRIMIVADRPSKYADLGLQCIVDETPGAGPLAGLEAALMYHGNSNTEDSANGWILVCSCDLVEVHAHWVGQLLHAAAKGTQAIAFRHGDGRWEPLFALYHNDVLDEVRTALQGARRSLQFLLNNISAIGLPLPVDWPELSQINTQQDFANATFFASS